MFHGASMLVHAADVVQSFHCVMGTAKQALSDCRCWHGGHRALSCSPMTRNMRLCLRTCVGVPGAGVSSALGPIDSGSSTPPNPRGVPAKQGASRQLAGSPEHGLSMQAQRLWC